VNDLEVGRGVTIPASELRVRFSRSGGPGGQNVNVRDTRVEVLFDVAASRALTPHQKRRVTEALASRLDAKGRIRVVASAQRTQAQNRERALDNLRSLLAEALKPPPRPRVGTRPSAAARERRLAAKRARAKVKRTRSKPVDD
jgi:ribosome-associated protein